jgi:glycosyltransferase involved in cell wall biosynthesis
MKKPVILHIINTLGTGGAEVLLRDTVASLEQYDHVVCYLYGADDLVSSFVPHPVYKLHHEGWKDFNSTVSKLKSIIEIHDVAIVHAHLLDATILSRQAVPDHVKYFFTIHNILSKDAFDANRLSRIAEQFTYKKDQYIISVSREALKDYQKSIGIKGPSFILYNYVHQKYFNLDYDYDQDITPGFRLVAVGNLRRQKNYPMILEALSLLRDLPVSLDIYGSGDMHDELQSIIYNKKINARLMGRADDVSKILLQYHAYIMGSLFEGFGISPMEAMAAGMPVILSDLDVFRELAEDVPRYFDPEDASSIADAIRFVLENWMEMKYRAMRGKRLVHRKASKEVYLNKLIEIYNHEEVK